MQKEVDQQQHNMSLTSEYSTATLLFNGAPYDHNTSVGDHGSNFNDIAKVLAQVELPSPSPNYLIEAAQSSGPYKVDDHLIERKAENEEKIRAQVRARVARDAEQRRRSRIHEKIHSLKELIPGCNKRDQASILDDAIEHIKSLQMQLQLNQTMQLTMGAGNMPHGLYMSPWRHSSPQEPYLDPYLMTRPMNEVGLYSSYFTSSYPVFSPFVSCSDPFVPPMRAGIGSRRLLPIPYPQCPSQTSEPISLSDTITLTGSRGGTES